MRAGLRGKCVRPFERARYYGNTFGRFTTPDWSAKVQGVPYADFKDPQSLNLYGYVRDNPIVRVDPDGHCPDGSNSCADANKLDSSIKQAINDSVKASNHKTADDKKGGSHEEGGEAHKDKDGKRVIAPAKSGPYKDVKNPGTAEIDPYNAADSSKQKPNDTQADLAWHVHPAATETVTSAGGQSQTSMGQSTTMGGSVKQQTFSFTQPPSDHDIQNAGAKLNIVVGARDKQVYVYDNSGVTCQESLKEFNK